MPSSLSPRDEEPSGFTLDSGAKNKPPSRNWPRARRVGRHVRAFPAIACSCRRPLIQLGSAHCGFTAQGPCEPELERGGEECLEASFTAEHNTLQVKRLAPRHLQDHQKSSRWGAAVGAPGGRTLLCRQAWSSKCMAAWRCNTTPKLWNVLRGPPPGRVNPSPSLGMP